MSYRSILNIPTENLSPLTDIENIQNGGSDYYRTVSVQDIDFNAGDYVVCSCESYEGGTQNDVWGAITFLDNGQQISNRAYIGQLIGKRIVLYLTEKPTTLCCYFGLNNGYTGKFSGVRINKLPQNFHTLCTVLGHNISEQEDVEHTSQTYLLTKYDNDWWDDFSQYKEKFDYIICGDVLEHLRFPQDTLKILKTYLKENGSIIASIPNIAHMSIKANLLVNDFTYTPLGLLDETHIHLFTYKSIAEMLSNLGLKIENCEWTLQSKQAWQPNNPYPNLSKNIQQFLFNDWHSFVCQYVVILNQTQDETNLLQHNIQKLNINEEKAPENIKTYRNQLLQELGEVDKIQDNQIQADIALKNKIIEEQEQSLKNTIKTNTEITQLLSTQKHEIEVLKNEINKNLNKMLENDKEINNLQKVLSEHENKILSQTLENQNLQQDIQKQSEKIEKLKNKIHRKKRKYQIIILSLCIIYLLMFISILAR